MKMTTTVATPYVKGEYIGAVTLLHFSQDGSLLFVGVGSTLYVYETFSGDLLAAHAVFPRGILHGRDYVRVPATCDREASSLAVFFGQKRLVCVRDVPETRHEALEQRELQRVGVSKTCQDWVFDARMLSDDTTANTSSFPIVAIGLAHNYIQFWDPLRNHVLRSVYCTERCILYSLAFFGRRASDLMVAAGTVFQQVLLWAPRDENDSQADRADPQQRLHGHDGVIFKLEWSSDAHKLASVSDDRTVQLWSHASAEDAASTPFDRATWLSTPYGSQFRAWGHTARLWDVRFTDVGIITTSEDTMARVWDWSGQCLATLQGHTGKHIWRVAVHPSQRLLATGGGDGAVKLWDLQQQVTSTIASAGETCVKIPLRQTVHVEVKDEKQEAVGEAHKTPVTKAKKQKSKASASAEVGVRDIELVGDSALVAMENGQVLELPVDGTIPSSPRVVFSAAGQFTDDNTAPSSSSKLSSFAMDEGQTHVLLSDWQGHVLVVAVDGWRVVAAWKAHSSRVMKVSWKQRLPNRPLFTCAADGSIAEWRWQGDGTPPSLVARYQGPAKSAATCVDVLDVDGRTRNVICGDGRGSVFGFARRLEDELSSGSAVEPHFVIRGAHGRDMVATLLRHERDSRVWLSGGHDGAISTYNAEQSDIDGRVTLRHVGRESIKGITTVKALWWNTRQELLVFGFHAVHALLFNATAQYRVFIVECGGWRRPHALAIRMGEAIPRHVLAFTPPVSRPADLHVLVHSTRSQLSPSALALQQCSLHHRFHGRMTTCCRVLDAHGHRLLTAAEDNSLKLHRRADCAGTWRAVSTGVAHTTTIRALTIFRADNRKAVFAVSGGGKQRLNAWRVADDLDVLELLCGHEQADADQDHRILGLASFRVGTSDRFRLLAACNSEGVIQLVLLDLGTATTPPQMTTLGDCSSSKKPILSCDGVQSFSEDGLELRVALLAVGSTDGLVNVWDLRALLDLLARDLRDDSQRALADALIADVRGLIAEQMAPRASFLAHDMGVNCLCMTMDPSAQELKIITGGDDQSLHVQTLSLPALELVQAARAVNASGSAIKAVAVTGDGRHVYCGGYDQRVSRWTLSVAGQLDWRCAAFTECADIADLDVWQSTGVGVDAHDVLVVGQGLQSIRFCN
ncbi:hypothetical protein ATCC90586_007483 [Pythium insidiosum]|nr:hypothetical protein ATCC90586_007483 [Pythium insidiosum]